MNKNLLITGASRGIGAATAILAAQNGYRVCINYRHNKKAAEEISQEIISHGGTTCCIQADISQEDDVLKLFKEMENQLGSITHLVNNAGILETQTRLENIDVDRFHRILNTNVIGSFLCSREAIKVMSIKNGGLGGAIVNVSSGASKLGSPNEYIDYAASKGAIDTMTIGLAKEVAEDGIRVNAVRPGYIYTDMHTDGGEPDRVNRVKEFVPMKRGGHPEEVAKAILWLLSDDASYTTGSFIDVMGGK